MICFVNLAVNCKMAEDTFVPLLLCFEFSTCHLTQFHILIHLWSSLKLYLAQWLKMKYHFYYFIIPFL